jgi:hypothetical protein
MTADIIAIIAALTLSAFILGILILPYLAASKHIVYSLDPTVITGVIAALSGIISAVAVKKLNNTCPPDSNQDQKKLKDDAKQ